MEHRGGQERGKGAERVGRHERVRRGKGEKWEILEERKGGEEDEREQEVDRETGNI